MILKLLLSTALFASITFLTTGQDSTDYYILKVEHKKKERLYYIDKGEKLVLRVSTDDKKHKGVLDSVTVDSIYLNGEQFGINQVRMILSKQMRSSLHFASFMQLFAGAILTAGGSILLVASPDAVSTYVGIGGIAVGVPLFVKGLVRYFRNNHLWIKKGWKLSTITLHEAMSDEDEEQ